MFSHIAQELGITVAQVEATVKLLDEGNTVPFIARYRKEVTGELKDEQLRVLAERLAYLRNVETRREEIIASITAQEKMTDALLAQIQAARKLQELEDLYLPYRPKKRTRASVARERGLEPLATRMLLQQDATGDALEIAAAFLTDEVPTAEEALQGAMDIVAEDISDSADVRAYLRERMQKQGSLQTSLSDDETHKDKFQHYDNYERAVRDLVSHQVLAINRGEKLGALKVRLAVPDEVYIQWITQRMTKGASIFSEYIAMAAADSYKRLVFPALERELRNGLTEMAEEQAIHIFGTNVKNLLLQAPLAGHVIMGLDPGYRTGCKMAIIDTQGNVLAHGAYYLTHSDAQRERAQKELAKLIRQYGVTLLSIGNGTASYETEQFVATMIAEEGLDCHYLITNEAGASVYSASPLAVEELPDLDVTIRGAVSIARRVQDPLAESVKIDPKAMGVGQYQHDVNQKRLGETLDDVVEQVVNFVGVELNTASAAILGHVAGISKTVAKNIVTFRQEHGAFTNRKQLLKVARLGPAAFTQCAGFLRIQQAENPLDNTPVHPESYDLARRIVEALGFSMEAINDSIRHQDLQKAVQSVVVEDLAKEVEAGVPTVRDILEALAKPGRDPREDLPAPLTRKQLVTLDDLPVGTVVTGTVHNVVDFGAFIDIGLKTKGLLHRSNFCLHREHPADVLAVGDIVEVDILEVDAKRDRIALGMKDRLAQRKKEAAAARRARERRQGRQSSKESYKKRRESPKVPRT